MAGDFCPIGRLSNYKDISTISNIISETLIKEIEKADYSIVNLECPIADVQDTPIIKDGPNLKCKESTYNLLADIGFNAVTLANNHLRDYGNSSVKKTIARLDSLQISHVGGGENISEASKILYYSDGKKKVAIINCCEHESSIAENGNAGANPIDPVNIYYSIIEGKKNADYVLVITHGGHEHFQLPSPRMQDLYRFFVDVGADAIVNHHQHCYSGYEEYKGKCIFYGLGNFMFDNIMVKGNKNWERGYMVALNFGESMKFQLIPYMQSQNNPFIRSLNEVETIQFSKSIVDLNNDICNRSVLCEKHMNFMCQKINRYEYFATPYFGKIMGGLYRRGYLPKFISQKKLVSMINYINCESHLDYLRMAFNKNISNDKY